MRTILVSCGACIFTAAGVLFAEPRPVQTVTGQGIESIASVKDGPTWWGTVKPVDPEKESARLLAEANSRIGATDNPGEPWVAIALPGYSTELHAHGYTEQSTDLWYLKTFYLERDKSTAHLAFRLGQIDDKDIVYLNGVVVARTGRMEDPRPQAYDRTRIYDIPDAAFRPGLNVLIIHVRGVFPLQMGMVRDLAEIGPSAEVHNKLRLKDFSEILLLACYFTAGSYFLFLFIRRRAERENLVFALFIYNMVCYQAIKTQFKFSLGLEQLTLKKIEYCLLYGTFPLFYYFIRTYFDVPKTRAWKIWDMVVLTPLVVFIGLCAHVIFTDDPRVYWAYQKNISQPLWLVYVAGIVGVLRTGLRQKSRDALYMLMGFGVLMLGIVADIVSNRGLINIPGVTSYFFAVFMLSLALVLANRFVRLNEEVEDLNENLERKVEDRTKQLNKSLSDIQELKEKQDGDYFLTSLLIDPLGGNHNESGSVRTEMVQRQMKRFAFRKWNAEIGGDHCAVHSIELKGRRATVFINGDAMGKSMQGAGGALVLGTVFQSVIARTQKTEEAGNRYPEQWLKDCFLELQNVFVSFDGSMFLSAFLGIVDEQSGLMYCINAEHPRPVLYRSGRAEFIETPILRKIGIPDVDAQLTIGTVQLAPDDVVIIGSDGRDDVSLGMDASGNRIINEDEEMFLRHVEQGQGMVDEITRLVFEFGAQADDYSLIRIAYREDAPVPQAKPEKTYTKEIAHIASLLRSQKPEEAKPIAESILLDASASDSALLYAARALRVTRDFDLAAAALEVYTLRNPHDTETLAALSVMLKVSGQRDAAIDTGERCRLRDPGNQKNLINLADAYRLSGNIRRARVILAQAQALNGNSPEVARLHALLSSSG